MAEYNVIDSTAANALVEGTEGNDSISVYGNHSTVQALGGADIISVNGGRHDNGIWLEGDETNVILAGEGNDSIYVQSRGASVFGEGGNDTVRIDNGHVYANGGAGNDLFYIPQYVKGFSTDFKVTLTGGAGIDTIEVYPYGDLVEIVATDFSNDDVLRIDGSYYQYSGYSHRVLTQSVENGNVVIRDNSSVSSYNGNNLSQAVEPLLSITLQGVSDISQVADAKYYFYEYNTPRDYKTFGELFGVSSTNTTTTPPATEPVATIATVEPEPIETVAPATNTDTNTTVVNNYYGDVYNFNDNNGTVVIGSSVTGDINNNVTITKYGNTYNYTGGNRVISNYQQGEVINLASDYAGIDVNGNSFYVKSSSGSLEIQNARDKFIGYSAGGEVGAYTYVAGLGGAIDGRGLAQAEIMIGSDNADNQIYAGGGGSSLWGGIGGNDILVGGAGYNEFFYAVGNGFDVVQNANANDLVNLVGVNGSQIANIDVNIGYVNFSFIDGGFLQVQGGNDVKYQIVEGTFSVNQYTKEWSVR